MNSLILAVIVIGGSTIAAILGLLLARKYWHSNKTHLHHEIGGYMLSVMGTLYAVVLGFVVVNVSDSVHQDKVNIGNEINAMLNMARIADGLPKKTEEEIRLACLDYSKAVVNEEWQMMPKGQLCMSTWRATKNIWVAIKSYKPESPQEQAFYSSILENFNTMVACRRTRLVTAAGYVSPILWVVLIGGGIMTITFTYFFSSQNFISQILMTALITITLSLNLYLVVLNSSPFCGEFRIKPTGFQLAGRVLEAKGELPPNLGDIKSSASGF